MTENIENLILEHLKRFQAGQERIEKDLDEIKARLSKWQRPKQQLLGGVLGLYAKFAASASEGAMLKF